jgi:hypothetical protein
VRNLNGIDIRIGMALTSVPRGDVNEFVSTKSKKSAAVICGASPWGSSREDPQL